MSPVIGLRDASTSSAGTITATSVALSHTINRTQMRSAANSADTPIRGVRMTASRRECFDFDFAHIEGLYRHVSWMSTQSIQLPESRSYSLAG